MPSIDKNTFSPGQGALIDSDGNIRNLADAITNDGKLKVDWADNVTLAVSDIQIGAVELKDKDTDTRAKITELGLEVEVKNTSAIPVSGSVTVDNTSPVPVNGSVTVDNTSPVLVSGTVTVDNTTAVPVSGNVTVDNTTPVPISGSVSIDAPTALPISGAVTVDNTTPIPVTGSFSIDTTSTVPVSGSVTVDNTSPVPVSGSVTVNNTAAVPVTGTVNVQSASALPISGSVTVNNTSAVPVSGSVTVNNTSNIPVTGSVTVSNTTTAPIPTRVMQHDARTKKRSTRNVTGGQAFASLDVATLVNNANRLVIYQIVIAQRMFDSGNYGARAGLYVAATNGADIFESDAIATNFFDNGSIAVDYGVDGFALPAGHNLKLRLHSYNTGTTCNGFVSAVFREVAPGEVLA